MAPLGGVAAWMEALLLGRRVGVGAAQVRLLFGLANPCGKLAETIPLKLQDNPSYLNFPGDGQVCRLSMGLFRENPERRALFAGYLGKLGDERALEPLMQAAQDDRGRYLDYIELRNAIEAISGQEVPERDFSGDALYDYLASGQGEDGIV